MSLKQTDLNVNEFTEGSTEQRSQERHVLQLNATTGGELQMFLAHAYICNPRGFVFFEQLLLLSFSCEFAWKVPFCLKIIRKCGILCFSSKGRLSVSTVKVRTKVHLTLSTVDATPPKTSIKNAASVWKCSCGCKIGCFKSLFDVGCDNELVYLHTHGAWGQQKLGLHECFMI